MHDVVLTKETLLQGQFHEAAARLKRMRRDLHAFPAPFVRTGREPFRDYA